MIDSADLKMSVDSLKERLLRSVLIEDHPKREALEEMLSTPKMWATDDVLALAAYELDLTFCVHLSDDPMRFVFGKGARRAHIRHRDGHFVGMVKKLELGALAYCLTVGQEVTEAIDLTDPHVVAAREKLFDEKTFTKGSINKAKTDYYQYSFLGNGGYVCRSGLKLKEILLDNSRVQLRGK